jgi:hypothetical protein
LNYRTGSIIVVVLVIFSALLVKPVHSSGLEYLGPGVLIPQPFPGVPATLQANAIVGNSGNSSSICSFTLVASQDFRSHFATTFWVNGSQLNHFTMDANRRQAFYVNFTFDPSTTPAINYTATISISASPANGTGGVGGIASLSEPVSILAIYLTQAGSTSTTETQVSTQTSASTTQSLTQSGTSSISQAGSFSIAVSPQALSMVISSSGFVSITVSSINGFEAPVTLSAINVPAQLYVTISPNPVTPPADASVSASANIAVDKSAPPGAYTFTISATSGSLRQDTTVNVQVSECVIATATYGSALSPEVQFLRDFRDHRILKTHAGSNFMLAFNAWYYSFSPTIAQIITQNPVARSAALVLISPLITILRIGAAAFDLTPGGLEAGAVVTGLLVSSLVGITFFSLPTYALLRQSSRARKISRRTMPLMSIFFLGAISLVVLAEFSTQTWLMATVTAASVLILLMVSALATGHGLFKIEESLRPRIARLRTFRPLSAFKGGR